MPIIDSRVRNGTLSLGETPVQFECQARNIELVPDHSQEDGVETLCGDTTAPSLTTTWSLDITAIQDFTDPDGFVIYTHDNNGTTVPFSWCPGDSATEPTWTGSCQVRAVTVGGEVATQLTTDASLPIIGTPTRTPPAGGAAATAKATAKA